MIRWKPPAISTEKLRTPELRKPRGGAWTRKANAHKAAHVHCASCGRIGPVETDHIVPLHRGGSNDWSNLQSLCKECHKAKTAAEAAHGW